MQRAVASVGRITELLQTESRLPEGRGSPIPAGPLAVELDGVSFAYEPGAPDAERDGLVLRDVSLRLAPGEVLGLLGRTGSASTTRPPAGYASAASICATRVSTTCAAARRW
jgi:ATP-binding cassette, subfamily B, bacterial